MPAILLHYTFPSSIAVLIFLEFFGDPTKIQKSLSNELNTSESSGHPTRRVKT